MFNSAFVLPHVQVQSSLTYFYPLINSIVSVTGIEPAFTNPITATCLEDRTDYTDIFLADREGLEPPHHLITFESHPS